MIKVIGPSQQSLALKTVKTSVKGIKKIGGLALGIANYVIGTDTQEQESESLEPNFTDQNSAYIDPDYKYNLQMFSSDKDFIK